MGEFHVRREQEKNIHSGGRDLRDLDNREREYTDDDDEKSIKTRNQEKYYSKNVDEEHDSRRSREHKRETFYDARKSRGCEKKSDFSSRKRRWESSSSSDDENEGKVLGASGAELIGYKSVPPHHTIMLRNLPVHITSNDIVKEFIHCGTTPKNIRVITNMKGESRGFAFVQFSTVEEAERYMKIQKGVFTLQNQYKSMMQFAIPEKPDRNPPEEFWDWFCAKCCGRNFKHRLACYRCDASRMESEMGGAGSDEVSSYKTKTIMLRNLDVLTTLETIVQTLKRAIPDLVGKITAVKISRDQLTSTSRGFCYLGTESTIDALVVFKRLENLVPPLRIDGKLVILSYCKYHMGDSKQAHDIPVVTDESIRHNYQPMNQMDSTNSAAAVAQSAIEERLVTKACLGNSFVSIPSGTDGKRYPTPDTTKFIYDANSGYYYDPQSGLYYNHVTRCFWNSVIQKYLYWDQENSTYTDQVIYNSIEAAPNKQVKTAKQDNEAKRIAKNMEKWVKKRCNQKKKPSDDNIRMSEEFLDFTTLVCNLCKRKLENGDSLKKHAQFSEIHQHNLLRLKTEPSFQKGNFASSQKLNQQHLEKSLDMNSHIFTNDVCRKKPSSHKTDVKVLRERNFEHDPETVLSTKYLKMKATSHNNLERQNFELLNTLTSNKQRTSPNPTVYRDRAEERRSRNGDTEQAEPSELKQIFEMSRHVPAASDATKPIDSDNVGNKLMRKMGWLEGQGLGKFNEGRTSIIQTEQRIDKAGLGNHPRTCYSSRGSYGEEGKKAMYARYRNLFEEK